MTLDPRIGKLNSGKFYCFPNGNDQPELIGSLKEIEAALGLKQSAGSACTSNGNRERTWKVTMRFQYPAWDEVDGIVFEGIRAVSKATANTAARRIADNDGHLRSGKGHVTFTAQEQ